MSSRRGCVFGVLTCSPRRRHATTAPLSPGIEYRTSYACGDAETVLERDALDPPVITCILLLIGHGDALDPPVIMELRCIGVVPNKLSLSTENAGTHASANEARAHGIYEHTHGRRPRHLVTVMLSKVQRYGAGLTPVY